LYFIKNRRKALPWFKDPSVKMSIWKIIKGSIGKDISKMAVPVFLNDPINFLQKSAEIMEYQDLLEKAADEPDPVLRLIYVSIFNVS